MYDIMKDDKPINNTEPLEFDGEYTIEGDIEMSMSEETSFDDAITQAMDEIAEEILQSLTEKYREEINKVELDIFSTCKENGLSSSDAAIELSNISNDIKGIYQNIVQTSNDYPDNEINFRRLAVLFGGMWIYKDFTEDIDAIQ